MIEAQNVIDLRAAPAIDRLVVIADAADVFVVALRQPWLAACGLPGCCPRPARRGWGEAAVTALAPIVDLTPSSDALRASTLSHEERDCRAGRGASRLRQQPQPQILRDVGVLILVDQDVFEALLVLAQHVRVLPEQADAFEQQIAEVGGVERLQPLLIGDVELLALAVGEARRPRRPAPGRASGRGSSSRRGSSRTREPASVSRRASRLPAAA